MCRSHASRDGSSKASMTVVMFVSFSHATRGTASGWCGSHASRDLLARRVELRRALCCGVD
eukprot:9423386-Pyramimonas_sp.AAC.1